MQPTGTIETISKVLGSVQWGLLFAIALLLPVIGRTPTIEIQPAAAPLILTGENLLENGAFDSDGGWDLRGNIDGRFEDGALIVRRTAQAGEAVIEQEQDIFLPADTPFQLNAQLRNPSQFSLHVRVSLEEKGTGRSIFCKFWLPPRSFSETYILRGQTPFPVETALAQVHIESTATATRFPVVIDAIQLRTREPDGRAPNCEIVGFPRRVDLSFAHVGILLLLLITAARTGFDAVYLQETERTIGRVIRSGGWWWGALVLWGGMVAWWAVIPTYAVYHTILLLLELGLGIVITMKVLRGGFIPVMVILLVAALPHAIIAIIQQINGGTIGLEILGERAFYAPNPYGFGPQAFRAYALSWHPNILGGFLSIVLMGAVALLVHLRGHIMGMVLTGVAMLIVGGGLLATSSRAAIAVPPAIMLLALVWVFRKQGRRFWVTAAGVAVLGIAALGIAAITPVGQQVVARFAEIRLTDEGVINRIFYEFEGTWEIFQQHPVTGVGMNNIEHGLLQLPEGVDTLPAHNVYVVVLAELGIVGGVLYTLGLWHPLRWLRNPDTTLRLMIAVVIGFALVIFLDYYFWSRLPLRPIGLWLLGIVWGLHLSHRDG